MDVTVWTDKPLARLIVVRLLDVDKGQVLQSGLYFCKDNTYFTKIINMKHETFVLFYQ